ncbi:oligopeptide/dipeptide ABC transporter, ATP-binding protein domain [Dorea sp. 5-2]|nr:oligopeptide/dipeptide ABC transporter, ATP-binding protein domain [Dorea sp. 5-2]
MENLLNVEHLTTVFRTYEGEVTAVNDVSFYVKKGEILGLVGESGCGKSVTSLSVMGLLPRKNSRIRSGSIVFDGQELTTLPRKAYDELRGNALAMIFQEPMTSLNPVFTIENQLREVIRNHDRSVSRQECRNRIQEVLNKVGIPGAENVMKQYPHQLSGGMRQRVMISMALINHSKLLIADEPTTALDVTIQAQILQLLKKLAKEEEMSIILITHDLSVVAEVCDRVQVMYCGRFVETASREAFFESPMHPYSKGLLKCIPYIGMSDQELYHIPGNVMHPADDEGGCSFAPRCPDADERCRASVAPMTEAAQGHYVRCFRCGASPMTSTEKEESDVSAGNE